MKYAKTNVGGMNLTGSLTKTRIIGLWKDVRRKNADKYKKYANRN